jgi:hypothetical protein
LISISTTIDPDVRLVMAMSFRSTPKALATSIMKASLGEGVKEDVVKVE